MADEEMSEAALLAKALHSITQRLVKLEAEQKALDQNMQHIAGALEAIIEVAMAKVKPQTEAGEDTVAGARGKRSDADPR